MKDKQAKLMLNRYRNVIVPMMYAEFSALINDENEDKTISQKKLNKYIRDLMYKISTILNLTDTDVKENLSMHERESQWAYRSALSAVQHTARERRIEHGLEKFYNEED
tara:strand:+ start:190 stop:516 length:327 start_codon:yes stop_codon:yes gene_type:complete